MLKTLYHINKYNRKLFALCGTAANGKFIQYYEFNTHSSGYYIFFIFVG